MRYRRLDPLDVVVYRGIPVTTVARMLVDLSDVLTPHQLTNVINEAAFRKRFRPRARRRRRCERANGRRNLHVLEKAHRSVPRRQRRDEERAIEDAFLALLQFADYPSRS